MSKIRRMAVVILTLGLAEAPGSPATRAARFTLGGHARRAAYITRNTVPVWARRHLYRSSYCSRVAASTATV